jgi:hypothetical protein
MDYLVKRAEYVRDYVVEFTFRDGTMKEIDLEPFLFGPVFEPLRAPEKFRKFRVSGGTIVWGNTADIAPETLYYDLGPVYPEKAPQSSAAP